MGVLVVLTVQSSVLDGDRSAGQQNQQRLFTHQAGERPQTFVAALRLTSAQLLPPACRELSALQHALLGAASGQSAAAGESPARQGNSVGHLT